MKLSRRQILELAGLTAVAGCDKLVLEGFTKGVPPITPTEDFYILQIGSVPSVSAEDWVLALPDGSSLTRDQLVDPIEAERTLECIGSGPRSQRIGNAVWGGRPLSDYIVRPDDAVDLVIEAVDGYHTAIPAELFDRVWLFWQMNGADLTEAHGFPARLLVEGHYGTKGVKWPTKLSWATEPYTGFWEAHGWSKTAEVLPNTFVVWPLDRAEVPRGEPYDIVGVAYAGGDPVTAVEIQVNGSGAWKPAVLEYDPGGLAWVVWRFTLNVPEDANEITVQARCTTASGAMSNDTVPTDVYQGWDGSMQVVLRVK